MASEDRGERELGKTTMDADEFQQMIRGELEDDVPRDDKTAEPEVQIKDAEPQIVQGDSREPEPDSSRPVESSTTDLQRALSTIESLRSEVNVLKSSMQPRVQEREPQIELAEFAPGIRLPKDENVWPIKLTSEILQSVGIHPGEKGELARGLNILANAFFMNLSGVLPPTIKQMIEYDQVERQRKNEHYTAFQRAYPDLVGAEDIVGATETMLRNAGIHRQGLSPVEYAANLATRARARIATLRNMTLDQYMASIESSNNNNRNSPNQTVTQMSRARMGRGAGRTSRPGARSDSDRELEEML